MPWASSKQSNFNWARDKCRNVCHVGFKENKFVLLENVFSAMGRLREHVNERKCRRINEISELTSSLAVFLGGIRFTKVT